MLSSKFLTGKDHLPALRSGYSFRSENGARDVLRGTEYREPLQIGSDRVALWRRTIAMVSDRHAAEGLRGPALN